MRRLATMLVSLAALAASIGGPAEAATDSVVIEQHSLTLPGGETVDYEIGTLYAPENRDDPKSRKIGVGFARIKALKPTGAPPVFWLPGGPGVSALDAFSAAPKQSRLPAWLTFRPVGDVVVVEQRGYTWRGEMLEEMSDALPLDQPASLRADTLTTRALARRAVANHPKADLSGYTIAAYAADVDDVRRALGYDKISLFAGSFGSQWSLAVMRLYPDIVARAVLSSTEPLNDGFDRPSYIFAALQRMAYDADRDPGLTPYLPKGGLMAAIGDLNRRFAADGPVRVTIADDQGRPVTVVLGAEDLQLALLSHTDDPGRWPAFILSLYHGRYDDWARETVESRRAAPTKLIPFLIDTSLATTADNAHLLRTDPALSFLGAWNFESNLATAADWPTPDIGDAIRRPRVNPTPIVFVHGDWDTSTPIENTLGLLPYFPNGRAILVHRAGHDGTFYQLREDAAAKQAVLDFLRTGATANLPTQAALSTPKFDLPAFPPPTDRR
ncbi:MAG TPA: alpha/beta fold hydrolase [Caulobacter sp.]|nr:alpha/beta fold hydrolase [Caulobacter sp.]